MGLMGWLQSFARRRNATMPNPAVDVLGAASLAPAPPENVGNVRVTEPNTPNPAPPLPHVIIPPKLSPADEASKLARGFRNRNPGNIDFHAGNKWTGQVGIEPPPRNGGRARFAVFDSHEHGIRALARLLENYQVKHNLRTVAGMIDRWAPPVENVTSAYVASVARAVGVGPHDPVDVTRYAVARPMVEAIIRKELGGCPYDAATIDEGLLRAGVVR